MKKYGKYEKMPDGTRAKPPKVKDLLLQTYFTSLISLALCVTMFLGTSYAWFTSEVNNNGNEIYIGTLKVGLYKLKDGAPVSLVSSDTNEEKLFSRDIRWEPGYTALETIQVANEGDLAFKYTLNFTDGTAKNADGSEAVLADVAEHFDVWVFNHYGKTYTAPTSYEEMTMTEGWVRVGSLAEVLNGTAVLENRSMYTVRQDDSDTDENTPNGTPDGVKTIDTYTIALHMNEETSDATLMGKKIGLNVKLVAYQMGSEKDSFDNSAYDDAQFVATDKELQKALDEAADGAVIRFANDITGDVTVTQKPDVKITIDGNGKTFTGELFVNGQSNRYETAALTVRNVKFVAKAGSDSVICLGKDNDTRYTNNVTIKDCTFDGANETATAVRSDAGGDWNLTLDGCTVNAGMHSVAQLKNVEKGLVITDCTAKTKNGINLNNTPNLNMSGCDFDVRGYAVRFGEGNSTNTTEKTFLIQNSTLKSACEESDDAVIVFRGEFATNATLTLTNTTLEGVRQTLNAGTAVVIN